MLQANLIKLYEKSFRENSDRSAVTDYFTGETYSYYGFASEIAKLHLLFEEAGIAPADIAKKLEEVKQTFFYGSADERVYYPVGDDMGYITDTGNDDVRTEGMSYGMMM